MEARLLHWLKKRILFHKSDFFLQFWLIFMQFRLNMSQTFLWIVRNKIAIAS